MRSSIPRIQLCTLLVLMLHHHVSFFNTAAAGEASRDPNTFKIVFLGEEFQFSLFPDFSSHSLAEMFCRWWQRTLSAVCA